MPKTRSPRKGTLQYWPRKRARRIYARVRSWPEAADAKPLGFAGYKAGMVHVIAVDNAPNSPTKGEKIAVPATVIECPPLKALSACFYKKTPHGIKCSTSVIASQLEKELKRKMVLPKTPKKKMEEIKPEEYEDVTLQVYTQPKLIKLKKKPEIFEISLGGKSVNEKLETAKSLLGREIKLADVFSPGEQVDIHSVTKGKGFQGPVKRFGVSIRAHKSEKTKRGPGNLGACTGNRSWTVAHAGQTGFHTRTEFNKWILSISSDSKMLNQKAGFVRYGFVNSDYALLKGSIPGPKKRLIRFIRSTRPNKRIPKEAPAFEVVSK